MGFRSTIVSEYYDGNIPEWFKEKYSDRLFFPGGILIVSKKEWKYYSGELFEDYQKALVESGFFDHFIDGFNYTVAIAVLAEDKMISKVLIGENGIRYFWMYEDDHETDHVWCQG